MSTWPRYIPVPLGELPRTALLQQRESWFYSFSSIDSLASIPDKLAKLTFELDALRASPDAPATALENLQRDIDLLREESAAGPNLMVALRKELDELRAQAKTEVQVMKYANVRVISQHRDDDDGRRLLQRAEKVWNWCTGQDEFLNGSKQEIAILCPKCKIPVDFQDKWDVKPLADAKRVMETVNGIADAELERDKIRRDLFALVLKDKHSGEQIEEMLGSCSLHDVRNIFYASKGISVTLPEGIALLVASLTSPMSNEKSKS